MQVSLRLITLKQTLGSVSHAGSNEHFKASAEHVLQHAKRRLDEHGKASGCVCEAAPQRPRSKPSADRVEALHHSRYEPFAGVTRIFLAFTKNKRSDPTTDSCQAQRCSERLVEGPASSVDAHAAR